MESNSLPALLLNNYEATEKILVLHTALETKKAKSFRLQNYTETSVSLNSNVSETDILL